MRVLRDSEEESLLYAFQLIYANVPSVNCVPCVPCSGEQHRCSGVEGTEEWNESGGHTRCFYHSGSVPFLRFAPLLRKPLLRARDLSTEWIIRVAQLRHVLPSFKYRFSCGFSSPERLRQNYLDD